MYIRASGIVSKREDKRAVAGSSFARFITPFERIMKRFEHPANWQAIPSSPLVPAFLYDTPLPSDVDATASSISGRM